MSRAFSALLLLLFITYPSAACCPAPRLGNWVINADQTVIMLWDAAAKKQHFIRQASFASQGDDFGFLIPSPTQPELAESGNEAFENLHHVTAPRVISRPRNEGGCNLGCAMLPESKSVAGAAPEVRVLEEKLVAGFNAVVLEADDADVLVAWLKDHEFNYSPAIADWARPYIEQKWKITALKVAKADEPNGEPKQEQTVRAGALRLSFDTDRPLFPYREPDYSRLTAGDEARQQELASRDRLLRIYFVANARYQGNLTPDQPWTGRAVWAGKLSNEQRTQLLGQLQLPATSGPAEFYLTEFEDRWPYKVAPADLYFDEATQQDDLRRPDVYVGRDTGSDVLLGSLVLLAFAPLFWRRGRSR